jgi:hypothetical protein
MLAQQSPMAGEGPSRERPPSGWGEWKAGLSERPEKSVLCGRQDLGSTKMPCVGELSGSATLPSEPAPAHVPRSAALEASASADIR